MRLTTLLPALVGTLALGCSQQQLANGPLFTGLLGISKQASLHLDYPVPDQEQIERELRQLVTLARKNLDASDRQQMPNALARTVFSQGGYQRDLNASHLPLMLLPQVMETHRGSCLGLAALYLTIAEQLELPLVGVLLPNHFAVRLEGNTGAPQYMELLRRGEVKPEDWFKTRFAVPHRARSYLRPLKTEETLAVYRYNLANEYRAMGQTQRAIETYRQVAKEFPDFAEAHANLGLLFQLSGDTTRAQLAYQRAFFANPDLDGLRNNMRQLEKSPGQDSKAAAPQR